MTKQLTVISDIAQTYGVDAETFEIIVRKTIMPTDHTREEFVQCCMVAKGHNLNPITKEIHFMRTKEGKIQPVVGVDGWVKKCNEHPQYDGLEFEDKFDDHGKPYSVTCSIYRKDRGRPVVVTEYFSECVRTHSKPGPWQSHPTRMLRHRALIQCARIAFGFAGLMDVDEFSQWQELDENRPHALKEIAEFAEPKAKVNIPPPSPPPGRKPLIPVTGEKQN